MARKVVPFMACGDLRGLDSDQTYSLKHEADYEWRPPVQRPIHPAYTEVSSSSATAVCYCVCGEGDGEGRTCCLPCQVRITLAS